MRIEAERAAAMRRAEKALGQQLQLNKELLQQLKQSGILTRSNGVRNVGAFNSSSSKSNSSTPTSNRNGADGSGSSNTFNNNFNRNNSGNISSSNVSTGEARAVESLLRDRLGHFKLDKVNSN